MDTNVRGFAYTREGKSLIFTLLPLGNRGKTLKREIIFGGESQIFVEHLKKSGYGTAGLA